MGYEVTDTKCCLKGVLRLKKFLLALPIALFVAVCLPFQSSALPLTSQEVGYLVQECPTLDEYPDSPAVIWDRKQLYTQDSKGREVKTVSYVILCGPMARLGWLNDQMVAPSGGSIELEQAAIFDPGSLKVTKHLVPDATELAKGHVMLSFPQMDDDYLLVLSYRQNFAEEGVLEDIAWLGSEYPTWEGSIQVRIAKDQELFYESSTATKSATDEDDKFRRYGWFYFKQPANRGMVGLVESSDPYIVFSLTKGQDRSVAVMNELASRKWPSLPEIYVETEGARREKGIMTIEKFWRSSSRIRGEGTFRSANLVPNNGPWTTWEAAYIAASWLENQGWKAEVWFQHAIPQDRDSLSCLEGFSHPVLQVAEPGARKSFYYVPGQPSEGGKIPASLRGKTIYTAGNKKLRKKSFSPTDVAKNRLSIDWDLKVDEDCNVAGTLDVRVRQAWTEAFEGLTSGNKELIYTLLPGLQGWISLDDDFVIKPLGSQGFKLVVPVKARSGITAPGGIMVAIPSVVPAAFFRLHDVVSSAVLKFPFVVEQSYRIKLPKKYRLLSVPIKQEQASMVNNYTSQYRLNSRTNVIEGEEKLIHNYVRVDAPYIPGYKHVLEMWGSWRNSELVLVPTK